MRFAICISGAFRANYKLALDSIYENLVNPLNADVFIETWDNYFEWPGMCGGNFVQRLFGDDIYKITPLCLSTEKLFKSKLPNTYKKLLNPIVSKLKINSITENYNVVQISLNSENSFNNILSKMDTTGVYVPNQYKMFYLLFKANEQMRLHEKNLTVPYDIVIRVRPDVVFEEKVDTKRFYEIDDNCALMKWVYPNSDGVYWGVDDAFFIAKPLVMNKLVSLWKNIPLTYKLSPFKNFKYRAHPLLTMWTCYNNISICAYDYSLSLQKVMDGFLPNICSEVNEDLYSLSQNNDTDYDLIINWIQKIEQKFELKILQILNEVNNGNQKK